MIEGLYKFTRPEGYFVNTRKEPGVDKEVIGRIPSGQLVTFFGENAVFADGHPWFKVDGGGWVAWQKGYFVPAFPLDLKQMMTAKIPSSYRIQTTWAGEYNHGVFRDGEYIFHVRGHDPLKAEVEVWRMDAGGFVTVVDGTLGEGRSYQPTADLVRIPYTMSIGALHSYPTNITEYQADGRTVGPAWPFNHYIKLHSYEAVLTMPRGATLKDVIEFRTSFNANGELPFERQVFSEGCLVEWEGIGSGRYSFAIAETTGIPFKWTVPKQVSIIPRPQPPVENKDIHQETLRLVQQIAKKLGVS